MPLVFRGIYNKNKWYHDPALIWLQSGDVPGDILGDFKTQQNTLSVFLVEDDHSNLERLITGYAANRKILTDLDYGLVNIDLLHAAGFKFDATPGDTPDSAVNIWHRDLVELSGRKTLLLAQIMFEQGQQERIRSKKLKEMLLQAIQNHWLDAVQINDDLKSKLGL